jgi:hypothetical protein
MREGLLMRNGGTKDGLQLLALGDSSSTDGSSAWLSAMACFIFASSCSIFEMSSAGTVGRIGFGEEMDRVREDAISASLTETSLSESRAEEERRKDR